jgi:hypothetical protein
MVENCFLPETEKLNNLKVEELNFLKRKGAQNANKGSKRNYHAYALH